MYFICYDFETTGRNSAWDQIIEVGAILTNENLEEIDTFESSCNLKPGIIPEPGALMVNEQIPGEKTNLSHYQFVKLMWGKFTHWINEYNPIAFIGYNSINFDEEFLRRTLYKNLFPPFLTTAHTFGIAGKRGDIINLARMANVFYPGTFRTTFNEKGKEVFKLGQLAYNNISEVDEKKLHSGFYDVQMTLEIAKIIKNKAPTLWNSSLKTMNKRDVLDFINEEAFVLSNEFYFGTSRTYLAAFICEGPKGALKVFDLRNDPNQFIGLEFQELKKIIDKTKPRIIRSIMQNKHPILMPPEPKFINSVVGYENIGIEELNRRANIIKHNIDFNSQLKRLIFEEKEEESHDQSDKEPEECIYSFGFASFQEKALMTKFHASDCQGKLEIADQFQNSHHNDFQAFQRGKIYSEFAKMILYEENKEILPEEEKQRIKKKLADRIFYPDTDTVRSSWNNVGRAHMQIEAMGNKFEDEGHKDNSKEVIFLFKIKELIEKIENEYGGY